MRRWRSGALCGVIASALALAAVARSASGATTRQGVNFEVSTKTIPLHVKAIDFLHRHYQYRLIAEEITRGLASEEQRLMALFDWTRSRIRPTPKGWPVIDDHILHIIIRGHGLDDQIADVFTTLSTYAGLPAFSWILADPVTGAHLRLCAVRAGRDWAVVDVWNGLSLRDEAGRFATLRQLAANPTLVAIRAGDVKLGGIPYARFFERFVAPQIPKPLRAELQMPGPRLWHEAGQILSRSAAWASAVDGALRRGVTLAKRNGWALP